MGYKSENLGTGERVVYVAHKHVIVLLKAAAQWIALFILVIFASVIINLQNWTGTAGTAKNILLVVCLVAAFLSFIAFGISYLVWQAEQYIITNERVIQVEGIINKQEFTTTLDKINDIQTSQSLLGRMLGYGTVDLISGSDAGINKLDYLDKPFEFKKIMLNAKNRYYGDASDFAPAPSYGNRQNEDDEFADRDRRRHGHVQNVNPQEQPYGAPRPQDYGIDPRGYAPPRQPQTYQQYPANTGGYAGQSQGQAPMTPQQIADSIQQLARLRDNGIISEAEFQSKKNELMNRL
ncbi:MAG TPA: PH domain-containing protein [Chloroflexia bacterium]|nr:PH domain-containing protein [Chloroflexia bacterium]